MRQTCRLNVMDRLSAMTSLSGEQRAAKSSHDGVAPYGVSRRCTALRTPFEGSSHSGELECLRYRSQIVKGSYDPLSAGMALRLADVRRHVSARIRFEACSVLLGLVADPSRAAEWGCSYCAALLAIYLWTRASAIRLFAASLHLSSER